MPRYVAVTTSDAGKIALHRQLPVLRISHAEIRIDRESRLGDGGRRVEPVGQRQRIGRTVLHAQAFRKRRTAAPSASRWTDTPTCCSKRRSPREPPSTMPEIGRQANRDPRLKAVLVGMNQRIGICCLSAVRSGIRHHRSSAVNPGAISRFTSRPYNSVIGAPYSQRIPAFSVSSGLIRQSSLT